MIEKYLPLGYKPNSTSCSELYSQAMKELALPAPSVKTVDFYKLDQITGGFRTREFSILCGSTGSGKTTFLANLAACFIKQREQVFVASVETGPTDFIRRVLSVFARRDLNTGDAIAVDLLKRIHVNHGSQIQSKFLDLSLYDNRFSVETLMSDISWHVKNRGTKIAMIDNLNFFMEVTRASDQIVEMDRVIHELIIFCKQIDVHVIMVMHPKKTDHGRVDSEFDIKGSSTAVQESHNVFLFNRARKEIQVPPEYQIEHCREVKIAKMRRRGKFVGQSLVFLSSDGVSYGEWEMI